MEGSGCNTLVAVVYCAATSLPAAVWVSDPKRIRTRLYAALRAAIRTLLGTSYYLVYCPGAWCSQSSCSWSLILYLSMCFARLERSTPQAGCSWLDCQVSRVRGTPRRRLRSSSRCSQSSPTTFACRAVCVRPENNGTSCAACARATSDSSHVVSCTLPPPPLPLVLCSVRVPSTSLGPPAAEVAAAAAADMFSVRVG